MKHELKSIAYHRNGISGEGFYVAIVESDGEDMLVVTFSEEQSAVRTAVFSADLIGKRDIEFGSNSYRGDHWHEWMLTVAIPEYRRQPHKTKMIL